MLKITIFSMTAGTTLKLEGRLNGAGVDELKSCWEILRAVGGKRLLGVDLADVTWASRRGAELLDLMHRDGGVVITGEDRTGRSSTVRGAPLLADHLPGQLLDDKRHAEPFSLLQNP